MLNCGSMTTGELVQTYPLGNPWFKGFHWHADGTRFLSHSGSTAADWVVLWDVETGKELYAVTQVAQIRSLAWNQDTNQILVAGEDGVRVWQLEAFN